MARREFLILFRKRLPISSNCPCDAAEPRRMIGNMKTKRARGGGIMKRLLVLCAATLLMASAADASDKRNGTQGADRGAQHATWRHGAYHGWGVAGHYRCVVPDVCASGYYAYGHWTGQPKTHCPCESGASRY